MSTATIILDEKLREYLLNVSVKEPEILRELREETAQMEYSAMQISPEQGAFMSFLVELIQAKRTLEIGVFTGYSALVVAMALSEDGIVTACDVSEEWANVGMKYWKKAQVEDKIDLRIAPALKTLDQLLSEGKQGTYDFAFIDADKIEYQGYFDKSLELLRIGGLIAIDNVLWGGSVIDDSIQDSSTKAIRNFNENLSSDPRVSISMVPIGDGLTLACKL
ncbi:MAG TPA: class I SAM-dependent methyltransferase [Candidatus Marinimicrobia bacterium]|jgi:predicted O-methyltransferase YrrM|nr:SAM-dependent methyltransferase [Candidatus Neomarinimicrobiota bacterium]MDP6143733.1 class I SAM-dependent methyltransferase [Candidatus Neomarinimicrobiota bacterium]MDP6260813.1 class I SAM-dependent methyltransferase [Candidatus Neomarinimicrobiota bacterium]MDP7127748.1 class I SAM-dependent methyltransferase [Candidatus Neomarinimicrobiota bacterium]MDP7336397.1 class I SAM-dependent methyltransferase [Candidatus Neomarinimicrobiota bacterium]|tara:strand:+ start:371 stop:1033 length:663 start_codon:yes stop_codon:yes gene_type:complete